MQSIILPPLPLTRLSLIVHFRAGGVATNGAQESAGTCKVMATHVVESSIKLVTQ